MTSSVTIACDIDSTDYACPLAFEIALNGQIVYATAWVDKSEHCEFALDDQDSQHVLEFVLRNKLDTHTSIDSLGNIVTDARIKINNLSFDGIPLGQVFVDQAEYRHDFNGHGPSTVERFYGEMGCNGRVSLQFTTPIYLWMLDHM